MLRRGGPSRAFVEARRAGGVWGLVRWVSARADRLPNCGRTRGLGSCTCLLTCAARRAGSSVRGPGRERVGERRSERVAAGLATVAVVAAAPPQGGGAGSGEIFDGGGSSGSGECDAAGAEAEEVAVAEVRKWKRVRGRLWGLVSWEPDPVLGEFPLEWKAERDLGAHWVARGRALTRAAGRVRAGAGRAAGAGRGSGG